MAMNAAGPSNPAVLEEFSAQFHAYGFRREAFAPAYGLAESTLAVTGNPVGAEPVMRCFDVAALERGQVRILDKGVAGGRRRSEEHTSELQSLMRISYAVFCLKKKKKNNN